MPSPCKGAPQWIRTTGLRLRRTCSFSSGFNWLEDLNPCQTLPDAALGPPGGMVEGVSGKVCVSLGRLQVLMPQHRPDLDERPSLAPPARRERRRARVAKRVPAHRVAGRAPDSQRRQPVVPPARRFVSPSVFSVSGREQQAVRVLGRVDRQQFEPSTDGLPRQPEKRHLPLAGPVLERSVGSAATPTPPDDDVRSRLIQMNVAQVDRPLLVFAYARPDREHDEQPVRLRDDRGRHHQVDLGPGQVRPRIACGFVASALKFDACDGVRSDDAFGDSVLEAAIQQLPDVLHRAEREPPWSSARACPQVGCVLLAERIEMILDVAVDDRRDRVIDEGCALDVVRPSVALVSDVAHA